MVEVNDLTISEKIKKACAAAGISVAELARRIGTSSQNLHQRLAVDRFNTQELEQIAAAIGCEFSADFIFPDGSRI